MSTNETEQLRIAQATVANTIMYCGVERDGRGWKISASVPASARAGVVLELGRGPEEPIEFRATTFREALEQATAAEVTLMGDPLQRFADLLRAAKMEPF